METVKLKKPLFVNGNYNRLGKRMRVILDREISDGVNTYRVWRSAGKPEVGYPRANNDRYLLYVEIGEFLAPLRVTEFQLIYDCGYEKAMKNLYGSWEGREQFFHELRSNPDADSLVAAAVAKENEEISRVGADPAVQADYVKKNLQDHIAIYEKAKRNDGASHPDFIGALAMNELEKCADFAQKYRKRCESIEHEEALKRQEQYHDLNQKADAALREAINTIQQGGVLKNENLTTYCEETDSCQTICVFNRLFKKYNIDLPARTKGWINHNLVSVSFLNSQISSLRYYRTNQAKSPESIWKYLNQLCNAVNEKSEV